MSESDGGSSSDVGGPTGTTNRFREWLLLDGDRLLIAGTLFVGVVVAVATLQVADVVPLESAQSTFYLFGGFVGGNLTLITVVVSISQLLLSRELQDPGELRTQIADASEYRSEAGAAADQVPPVKPLGFLRLLVENTRQEAQRLGGLAYDELPPDVRTEVTDVVGDVTANLDEVDELLVGSHPDTFSVLSTTLKTNYAVHLRRLEQVSADHPDLPGDVSASLDELSDRLREIDVARQYLKSIYLQEELSKLSRMLLYVGLPAVATATFVLLTYTDAAFAALSRPAFEAAFPVAVGLGFLPLIVLASFVVRITTVTERTAVTLPFTTPRQEV